MAFKKQTKDDSEVIAAPLKDTDKGSVKHANDQAQIKILSIVDSLTIQEVNEISQTLHTLFDNPMDIIIEAEHVQRIDGAGLQLLCAIFKEGERQNVNVNWQGDVSVIQDAAKKIGVYDYLKF